MEKKNKLYLIIFVFFSIIITLIIVIVLLGDKNLKYDNDTEFTNLITEKHADNTAEKMKNCFMQGQSDLAELKANYSIQCLRKTYQGYYAVFLQSDNKRIFVFTDNESKINNIFAYDEIKTESSYDYINVGSTTESEILKFDENTILLPASSAVCTAHIVKEGLLVITYDRVDPSTGELVDDPIVKSVLFFKNEDFPLDDNDMINLNVPFILEKDKK